MSYERELAEAKRRRQERPGPPPPPPAPFDRRRAREVEPSLVELEKAIAAFAAEASPISGTCVWRHVASEQWAGTQRFEFSDGTVSTFEGLISGGHSPTAFDAGLVLLDAEELPASGAHRYHMAGTTRTSPPGPPVLGADLRPVRWTAPWVEGRSGWRTFAPVKQTAGPFALSVQPATPAGKKVEPPWLTVHGDGRWVVGNATVPNVEALVQNGGVTAEWQTRDWTKTERYTAAECIAGWMSAVAISLA